MSEHHSPPKPILAEATLNTLSEAIKPTPLSAERKQALKTRLFSRLNAPAPEGTRTIRTDEKTWIRINPLIEIKVLRKDLKNNNQTSLWRLQPGAVIIGHSHTQEEECLVLSGEVYVGDHCVKQGDLHIASPGCTHAEISTKTGALFLVRGEIADLPVQRR